MSLLTILIALIVIGIVLYLINQFIPMDGKIKLILNIIVIVFVVVWAMKALGVWTYLSSIRL